MAEPHLQADLKTLESEILSLKQERRRLIEEIKIMREEKRNVLTSLKEINNQLKTQTDLRDGELNELRMLIEESKQIRARMQESLQALAASKKELAAAGRAHKEGSSEEIEQAIAELEWRLQTERLSREQEKALLLRIKEMHLKKVEIKQREAALEKLKQLSIESTNLSEKLKEIKVKIDEAKKKIEATKEAIYNLLERRENRRGELERLNRSIQEKEEQLNNIQTKLLASLVKRRELLEAKRQEEAEKAREKMMQEISRLKEDIRNRLLEGKKVELGELKLLLNPEDEIA